MVEALTAEFQLLTKGFRQEIANVVRDIGKVGDALNSLGAGSTGLEKSVSELGKVGTATKTATAATKEAAVAKEQMGKASAAVSVALANEENKYAAISAALTRNIAIYQQAAAAGQTYTQAQQKIAAANNAAQFSNQKHAATIGQLTTQYKQLQTQLQQTKPAAQFQEADKHARSLLGTLTSMLGRIALFSIGAGLVVRGFFAINQAIKDVISEGLRFNATMEEGQIAIAGVLSSSRQVADESGKIVGPLEAYPFLLEQAAKIQKEIFIANINTLGTAEELQGVYLQILASTKGQVEAEGDLLKAAQIVTNIGKIRGQNGEKLTAEARQLFTLESKVGQTVLQTLGVRFQTAKALRDQGKWLQEVVARGEVWLQISDKLSTTWTALASSAASFFSLMAASAFEETFAGLKDIMKGVADEFQKISSSGGLTAALDLTPQQLNELGRALGRLIIDFVSGLAKASNAVIEFTNAVRVAVNQVTDDLAAIDTNFANFFTKSYVLTIAVNLIPSLSELAKTIDTFINKLPNLDPRQQQHDPAALAAFAKDFEKRQKDAVTAAKEFTRVVDEQGAAAKNTGEKLKIIPGVLDKTDESAKKAEKSARQLADAMDKLAAAQLRYQEQLAQVSNDPADIAKVQALRLKNIDTSLKEEVLKYKGNAAAITAITKAAEIDRTEAVAQGVQDRLDQLERISNFYRQESALAKDRDLAIIESAQTVRDAEIAAVQQQLDIAQKRSGTYLEQIALIEQIGDLQVQSSQANVQAIQREIDARRVLILSLQLQQEAAANAAGQATNDLARQNALKGVLDLSQKIGTENNNLTKLQGDLTAATIKTGTAAKEAGQALTDAKTQVVRFGGDVVQAINGIFDQLISGTLNFKKILADFGVGIGRTFVNGLAEALVAKVGFDATFAKNINGLGGILGAFGSSMSTVFSGVFDLIGGNLGVLKAGTSVLLDGLKNFDFASISQGISGIFEGIGPVGGALLGIGGAGLFSNLLGINKSSEAKLGSEVGGFLSGAIGIGLEMIFKIPGLGALGGFLGNIIGGLFGDLFAHVPTKGTQIRKGVVKWLKEIESEFAGEIKAGTYGFDWIKDFMKRNDMEFLEASKHFIPENFVDVVKQGLDKQLLALGLVITSTTSKKLGKDLNQTGVTFANMIADNLAGDPRKIQAFIEDLVQKGQFTLENMIESLNKSFLDGRIAADLYNDAIAGTVRLFVTDLPQAIDIDKIIGKSMVDGVIDVDKLKAQIQGIKAEFESLKGAISGALEEGIDAAAAGKPMSMQKFAKSFSDQLKEVLRNSIVEAVTEGIAGMLTSGVLGGIMADIASAAADFGQGKTSKDDFAARLRELTDKAEPEIRRLAQAFGPLGEMFTQFLEDLGLIPSTIAEVASTFGTIDFAQFGQGLIESIKEQMAQTGGIIPADLIDNMRANIGMAISDAFVAGVTEDMIQPWIDRLGMLFKRSIDKAMEDGVVTAEEMEQIFRKAGRNFEKIPEQVQAGFDLIDQWTSSPAYQKIREMFNAREMLQGFEESISGTGKSLLDNIKGQLAASGGILPQDLLDQLQLDISMAISDAFLSGIVETMIQPWIDKIAREFSSGFKKAMKDGVISAEEMSDIFEKAGKNFEKIPENVKAAFDFIDKWVSSPEYKKIQQIFQAREMQKQLTDSFKGIGKSLVDEIKKQLQETGQLDLGALTTTLKDQVGDAIGSAIIDAVVQVAIIGPIMEMAMAPFTTAFGEAMADGVISAAEMAGLLALGAGAMEKIPGFLAAGLEVLTPWLEGLKNILPKGSATPTGGGGGGGGGGGKGTTETDRKNALKETLEAQKAFKEALKQTFEDLAKTFDDAADTLADQFEDIQAKLDGALNDLQGSLGYVFEQLIKGMKAQGVEVKGVEDLLNLPAIIEGLAGFPKQYAERALQTFKDTLKAMGFSWEEVLGIITKLQKDAEKARQKAIKDLLKSFDDFIMGGEENAIESLFSEFNKLQEQLLANAELLMKNGVDVEKLWGDLFEALKKKLQEAVKEFLQPFDEFIKGTSEGDAFTAIFDEFQRLQELLIKNADSLIKAGVDVDKLWKDLLAGLKRQIQKAVKEFLEPFNEFIKGDTGDALTALFDQFKELEAKLKKNAALLLKHGVDVEKLWEDLVAGLKRELRKLRTELLDPIKDAIKDIDPGKIAPLSKFLNDIKGADSLDQLAQIRDFAIDAIRRTLEAQIDAARKASEARIKKLQEEHDLQVNSLNESKTALQRLIQLQQQKYAEEQQRINSMRDASKSLFQAAADMNLSNVSPLTPIQRMNEAQKKFSDTLAKAKAGDVEAAKLLPQLAQQLLTEARVVFASSPMFTAIFNSVQDALEGVGIDLDKQADKAQKQLDALNNLETIDEEIARLTKELGLTGKESLKELTKLEKTIDDVIKQLNKKLEDAIKAEQKALELKIEKFQNLAVERLKKLQEVLGKKFDQLIAAILGKLKPPPGPRLPPRDWPDLPGPGPRPPGGRFPRRDPPDLPGPHGFSYEALASAFMEAMDKQQPQSISIPIQVVTADGKVIANTVIRRLSNDSSQGKILIDAKGSGEQGFSNGGF